jgi:hypothetical protein
MSIFSNSFQCLVIGNTIYTICSDRILSSLPCIPVGQFLYILLYRILNFISCVRWSKLDNQCRSIFRRSKDSHAIGQAAGALPKCDQCLKSNVQPCGPCQFSSHPVKSVLSYKTSDNWCPCHLLDNLECLIRYDNSYCPSSRGYRITTHEQWWSLSTRYDFLPSFKINLGQSLHIYI